MAIKNCNTTSPVPLTFRSIREAKVCDDGRSRGIAYDRNEKMVTFTTPKGITLDFSKEDVFDILLKSMKTM